MAVPGAGRDRVRIDSKRAYPGTGSNPRGKAFGRMGKAATSRAGDREEGLAEVGGRPAPLKVELMLFHF